MLNKERAYSLGLYVLIVGLGCLVAGLLFGNGIVGGIGTVSIALALAAFVVGSTL